jgi:hypothetical protein
MTPSARVESWEKIAAFSFDVVFLAIILIVVILVPNPTAAQMLIFRVVLAMAAAGIAAVVPGFLQLNIPTYLRAGGAIAVFALIYWVNPASLVTDDSHPKDRNTKKFIESPVDALREAKSSLNGATVTFHTNDKPKRSSTKVFVLLQGPQSIEIARADNIKGHFDPDSADGPFPLALSSPFVMDDITSSTVTTRIEPRVGARNEKWTFDLTLRLTFADGKVIEKKLKGLTLTTAKNTRTDRL